MFQVERGRSFGDVRIFDTERAANFRIISGIVQSPVMAALLTWGGRQIPFEFVTDSAQDELTGLQYSQTFFVNTFGESSTVLRVAGIGPYRFSGTEERDQARLIAIEALFVYLYQWAPGEWNVNASRVVGGGREWKASDFGYGGASGAEEQ